MSSLSSRYKNLAPLPKKRVVRALMLETNEYVPEGNYGMATSPAFWRRVFVRIYKDEPIDDTDKRWDELFKVGYPLLRSLLDQTQG